MTSTAHFDSAVDTASERQPGQPAARQRTFEWSDPRETAEFGAGLSGMDFFTAMVEGRVPPPPIMQTIGISGFSFEEGRVVFRLTPQEFHYNPLGSVHGGVFATLLDSACGCAVHTKLPVGVFYTSLDLSVKFLRPVSIATGEIAAEATVVHLGRRMALAEGRIVDAAGKVYATSSSSCLIMQPGQ
jgi:uncharacterized protein (TIGR00369 family)